MNSAVTGDAALKYPLLYPLIINIVYYFMLQAFHDIAYRADSREDLLTAINGFLDDTVVLPPGEWDRNVLLPILIEQSRAMARRRKMAKAGKN